MSWNDHANAKAKVFMALPSARTHASGAKPALSALAWTRWLPWAYLACLVAAEILIALAYPLVGLACHALLLIGLTLDAALAGSADERKLALSLTLAPLTRLLSLSLPLAQLPLIAWYPIISALVLTAAVIVIRQARISRLQLGLSARNLPLQLLLIGGGLGLGALEYTLLQPKPLTADLSWDAIWLPALILMVCTGFGEELIFRGVLQAAATPILGRAAIIYVALLFAAMHIGYLSPANIAVLFAVGLLFGQIVRWGGSIIGVSLAHGLTNVTLLLIMPHLAKQPSSMLTSAAPWALWIGAGVALVAADMLRLRAALRRSPAPQVEPPGYQIRKLRHTAQLTYTDVAQRTGISARLLAEIEHGLRLPQPEQLRLIIESLSGVPALPAAAYRS